MQKPINLFGIYRPPDGKYNKFIQHITTMLNQCDRIRSETILIGDFNIYFSNLVVTDYGVNLCTIVRCR